MKSNLDFARGLALTLVTAEIGIEHDAPLETGLFSPAALASGAAQIRAMWYGETYRCFASCFR